MSIVEGVERDLEEIRRADQGLAEGALAQAALELARRMDRPKTSPTAVAACGRSLLDVMDRLRDLAPEAEVPDGVSDLERKREERRAAVRRAVSADSARS